MCRCADVRRCVFYMDHMITRSQADARIQTTDWRNTIAYARPLVYGRLEILQTQLKMWAYNRNVLFSWKNSTFGAMLQTSANKQCPLPWTIVILLNFKNVGSFNGFKFKEYCCVFSVYRQCCLSLSNSDRLNTYLQHHSVRFVWMNIWAKYTL